MIYSIYFQSFLRWSISLQSYLLHHGVQQSVHSVRCAEWKLTSAAAWGNYVSATLHLLLTLKSHLPICRPLLVHRMTLVSFRLFRKNLGSLKEFFGQMAHRPPPPPPWQKMPVRLWSAVFSFPKFESTGETILSTAEMIYSNKVFKLLKRHVPANSFVKFCHIHSVQVAVILSFLPFWSQTSKI